MDLSLLQGIGLEAAKLDELVSRLRLAEPQFLLFLLLLPVIWIRSRGRPVAVTSWRSALVCLLVVALAGPELRRETSVTEREQRVFAFDLSRSVPPRLRAWMAREARERYGLTSEDRVVLFGGRVHETKDWELWLAGETSTEALQPQATNLESLFSHLLKSPEPERKLFLFSDGWETEGDVERLIPLLRSGNLKVMPVAPSQYDAANVAVKRILAPHHATLGDNVQLKVLLENTNAAPVEGTLALKRNGQALRTEAVTLKPGSQMLSFESVLSDDGMVAYEAVFSARATATDTYPGDNRAIAWISTRAKEKVLLLNGRSGQGKYLEEVLRRRGFEVTSVTVGNPPAAAGYGLVIFNNVEREKFSDSYLAAIERHVAAGNSFLMLGGDASFGFPGYRKTPVANVLPVEIKEPPKKEEKNRAVVLVIDKSGSMREDNRILYAQEAAKAMLGQLRDRDLVGVIAFDVSAFVVVPLSQVETVRGTFQSQVDRLKAGGRTYLLPGIVEAKRQLERQNASQKHVIILSDGDTGGSQGDYIDLTTLMRRESKITVSVVAIGQDVNIPLLKRIAQYGGGFYHHTYDPRTLPKIIAEQVEDKAEEPKAPEEKVFTPVAVRASQLLASFRANGYPTVRGYVETELKDGAHLDLVLQENRHPLMASWSYRSGKAVAFTTDLQGFWSRDWIRWPELERFWNEVFNWLRPQKETVPAHEVRINVDQERPVLDLYVYSEEAASGEFRYSYSADGKKGDGLLKRLAPGHYQTALPFSAPGDYRIDLVQEINGQKRAYPSVRYALTNNPRAEVPRSSPNSRLLEQLARASGGTINPQEVEITSTERKFEAARPLRAPLVAVSGILFLLEIYLRRFVFGGLPEA
ncbi:MAG TPA: VWA domain-containing protein [Candidatus Eisenbacteria bacterium]|nr:VWA domain-containing protein [Candidatus Eisenbacteria bacterium]